MLYSVDRKVYGAAARARRTEVSKLAHSVEQFLDTEQVVGSSPTLAKMQKPRAAQDENGLLPEWKHVRSDDSSQGCGCVGENERRWGAPLDCPAG